MTASLFRPPPGDDGAGTAWDVLLSVAGWAHDTVPPGEDEAAFAPAVSGALERVSPASDLAWLHWRRDAGWSVAASVPTRGRALLDLYLPVCSGTPGRVTTVAHLGQSIDGFIATESGDSHYVTGQGNILHLHRMRALCDAVVVGAETVASDDPRLTVRLARGPNPTRVILDPNRRLGADRRVFGDRLAPTLLICDVDRLHRDGPAPGGAELIGIPTVNGQLALDALLDTLRARGLSRLFIEGGGQTVSAFVQAGLVDRLQVAVAPLITGAGRPGLRLAPQLRLTDCLRPACSVYRMGADVLFNFDLRSSAAGTDGSVLERIL